MSQSINLISSVSVVITTYNRPDYLQQALQSVFEQTHPIKQIIIVDDCSPVGLQGLLEQFPDQRIVYERLSVNSGPNRARNRGVELASSDWVAFLDDDDAWLPEKLQVQFQGLLNISNDQGWIGALCSYRFMETGKDRLWGHTGKVQLETLKTGNPYCGASGLLVKKELIAELKFDESLQCGQDWDIFVRLSKAGALLYLQEPLLLYRRGSHDSVTLKAKKLNIPDLEPRLASIYKHKDWLGDTAFRQRVANQTLAYVFQKKRPLEWFKESVRLAGWSATISALWLKLGARFNSYFNSQNTGSNKREASK